ncbi:serine/threonine-protein kinase [Thermopolyspora sp. NPDC052614]|uniref:serine/threonine protein kinase n=1 Tax=Thermopolyspora sp. NPDC052614 TaxID=3155682 RepID=UPI00342496DF
MTGIAPLRTGDPPRIGPYRLLGRLGQGGQGAVFLGTADDRRRVAVKLLHANRDDAATARFLREIEILRQVSAFCTAQVLDTGLVDGRPYIVSEYVSGPTLHDAVAAEGVLRGGRLRRLAAGTLTALVAIHRAGVVHRDFKPSNVLLAGDGPRVIDFGIARDMDAAATSSRAIGTPPYMAPEQFASGNVGPEADLFAWAATMVFAASGRPPFGQDTIPSIIYRVLNEPPHLGDLHHELDADLHDLITACLDKDPRRRPTARQALLRLLGARRLRPLLKAGTAAATDQPVQTPATRPKKAAIRIAASATAALTLAGALYLLNPLRTDTPPQSTTTVSSRPDTSPPLPATRRLRLPGLRATLHENPADPIRVTSLLHVDRAAGTTHTYARTDDTFRQVAEAHEALPSPGGEWLALVPWLKPETPGANDTLRLIKIATGEEFQIPVARTPLRTFAPYWSADGRRLLLTLYEPTPRGLLAIGFVIVDAPTAKATTIMADTADRSDTSFMWAPGDTGVTHRFTHNSAVGLRVFDLHGNPVRDYPNVGEPSHRESTYTPTATHFATTCPKPPTSICIWNTHTGHHETTVPVPTGTTLIGWYNDANLLIADETHTPRRIVALDLTGRITRVLAEIPTAEYGPSKLLLRLTRR